MIADSSILLLTDPLKVTATLYSLSITSWLLPTVGTVTDRLLFYYEALRITVAAQIEEGKNSVKNKTKNNNYVLSHILMIYC